MMKRIENKVVGQFIKFGILILFSIPLLFQFIKIKQFTPLNGVQNSKSEQIYDSLNGHLNFSDRSFQSCAENQLEEKLNMKSPLVRLRNQYEYSLFNKINAQQIYQYNNQLFRFYVPDYNEGTLFLGEKVIHKKIEKLKYIQNYIDENHPIITIIAPSKTYFYSELLPKKNTIQTENSNYKRIQNELIQNNLLTIDFNRWFLKIKNKKEAPLFGKGGIHWTIYGATLAMDSLVSFMNTKFDANYHKPEWSLSKKYNFFYNDQDLAQLLNVFKAPNDLSVRNPLFKVSKKKTRKIKALIISDSFFDVVSITDLRNQVFTSDSEFLYYFNTRKDPTNNNQTIDKSKLLDKLKTVDCVILMNDIVNMENFGWGFIETTFDQIKEETIKGIRGHKR